MHNEPVIFRKNLLRFQGFKEKERKKQKECFYGTFGEEHIQKIYYKYV